MACPVTTQSGHLANVLIKWNFYNMNNIFLSICLLMMSLSPLSASEQGSHSDFTLTQRGCVSIKKFIAEKYWYSALDINKTSCKNLIKFKEVLLNHYPKIRIKSMKNYERDRAEYNKRVLKKKFITIDERLKQYKEALLGKRYAPSEDFVIKNVRGEAIYIKFDTFNTSTETNIKMTRRLLRELKINTLIVDIRSNRGGDIVPLVNVTKMLSISNKNIGSIKHRDSEDNKFYTTYPRSQPRLKLILLVSKNTKAGATWFVDSLLQNSTSIMAGDSIIGMGQVKSYSMAINNLILAATGMIYSSDGSILEGKKISPSFKWFENIDSKKELSDFEIWNFYRAAKKYFPKNIVVPKAITNTKINDIKATMRKQTHNKIKLSDDVRYWYISKILGTMKRADHLAVGMQVKNQTVCGHIYSSAYGTNKLDRSLIIGKETHSFEDDEESFYVYYTSSYFSDKNELGKARITVSDNDLTWESSSKKLSRSYFWGDALLTQTTKPYALVSKNTINQCKIAYEKLKKGTLEGTDLYLGP